MAAGTKNGAGGMRRGFGKAGKVRPRASLRHALGPAVFAAALAVPPGLAFAFDFKLHTSGSGEELRDIIRAASLTFAAQRDDVTNAQDIFAAARADYARILGALYAEGHYSGVIHILVDGREAANIAPLDAPDRIGRVEITVDPGPQFRFSRAAAGPLAPDTKLPEGYAAGQPARSGEIVSAAEAGVDGWRADGHAKARVSGQEITANHAQDTLAAAIAFAPGPVVTFGDMAITGNRRTLPRRIDKIAGFPSGERFDPEEVDRVLERLRRTGTFRSVSLTEAETLGPGNTLDYTLAVVEEKKRKLSFGAELSSLDGLTLSGYWLHRNLLRGAESLRIDAEIGGIGAQTGGEDYKLGFRFERPGTPFRDNTAFIAGSAERLNEEDYTANTAELSFGLTRYISDELTVEAGLGYAASNTSTDFGNPRFRQIVLPVSATWDSRDEPLDATSGYYAKAEVMPFYGLKTTGNGARITFDTRAYRGFGADDRFVLAGRLQGGSILGAGLEETPLDYLFYSGGGGTVRGQPYQSLGVFEIGPHDRTGGTSFLAVSGEMRADITASIGMVAFYDAGFVGADDLFGDGEWHSGAGLGLRYNTGIGPIRLDVAGPVSGSTGDGVQLYIGIGQAF